MARRKAEIQLQMQVESQEEWEDLLSKEGLNVVDVYQEWCGPCTGMVANLRRLKNELGDDLLRFATAKADTIDALEKYRGHCEPCFLFYAGGCLVAVVRGANSPKILRVITEQLKQEHKVLDGNGERKEIKDPFISQMESKENEPEKEEEEEEEVPVHAPVKKEQPENVMEVTVALIKPDAVQAGKVDEILKDIKAHGIKILRHEERHMTEDEVRQFYSHLQDQDFFDELVKFMTSGPSHILALTKGKTGENIIKEFRDLIGPTDVEEAKTQKPESLRAKHGQQAFMNALHGSSSSEMATRELAFFFPDFVAPAVEGKQQKLQRTLALVRPDAFKMHKDQILAKIRESGFKVAMQKEMQLTKEMAEEFYKEHKGQPYFEQLVTNMSSGPVLALGLAREDAIEGWRKMLGPKEVPKAKEVAPESLRAQFAVNDVINPLHGSKSEAAAEKELQFFFPVEQTVAVIKPDAEGTKDEIIERIHEAGFRIAARKETTLSREVAEKFYADQKGKEYYNDLIEHMTSGPTYLMVLSREAAVEGWRSLIGPTDPAQAKQVNPNSIRATYGASILKNAVHGSSNPQHAQQTIKALFGDLKFSKDGDILETIKEEADGDAEQKGHDAEMPTAKEEEKPEAETSEDAKEVSPEYREREQAKEVKKEEEQQGPSDKQSPEEVVNDEPPTEETTDDNLPTAPESDDKETKEATPQVEEKKEEKAPSPKPSETEAKPAEAEAKPSATEAKPEEQQEGSTVEKKSEEQTEQKTDSTAQGEDVKKEEVKAEENTPEAPSTEETKVETKEETKADGAD